MMLTYQRERFADMWEEVLPLFNRHWDEVEDPSITGRPCPVKESYVALENNGGVMAMIARSEGKIVGYAFFYTYRHMHYPDKIYALNDVLFLLPEYRVTNAGYKLMKESERMVREAGANTVLWCVTEFKDFSPLLKRMGYHKKETTYIKTFGDE